MIKAFYNALTSAQANQTYLDVISNNLANLQTSGYKVDKAEFSDLLYTNMNQAAGYPDLMVGSGSKLNKTDTIFSQGAVIPTSSNLDFAIDGDGFFGIQKDDEIYFTRNGSFTIGIIDEEKYLMLDNGYVLDSDENPIIVEENDVQNTAILPAVFTFENNEDLVRVGESIYMIGNDEASYEIQENPNVLRGYIEASNVNLAEEMVKLIKTQRAFQFNSKVIQTADEIEQTINSLRS